MLIGVRVSVTDGTGLLKGELLNLYMSYRNK